MRDPAEAGTGERDGSAATGRSEGEAGRGDRPDRGERHERRARDADDADAPDRSRASDGASEGAAGREDRPERTDRSDRRAKDAGERGADRDDAGEGAAEGVEGKGRPAGSLTELDGEKRSEVQSVFRARKSEAIVKDIDVDVSIGVSIPRTVALHVVPQEVVVLVPEYRAYKYFIYEDQVIIVDPDTLEIVDILVLA